MRTLIISLLIALFCLPASAQVKWSAPTGQYPSQWDQAAPPPADAPAQYPYPQGYYGYYGNPQVPNYYDYGDQRGKFGPPRPGNPFFN